MLVPTPLALDLRDSPLAVAIYLCIARAFLVRQAPVPLSAADVQAYDAAATLSRGAVTRALDRLAGGGWIISHTRPGHKSAYLPAWGRHAGAPVPWAMDTPALGRPRAVKTLRLPAVLLDVCLGRLTPHARHPAIVTRYLTRPALTLSDVGAYTLCLADAGAPTDGLARLGLADEAGVLPPPDPATLLAQLSQLPLRHPAPDAPALSGRGLRRVGLAQTRVMSGARPLFFVPSEVIGVVIAPVIGGVIETGPEVRVARGAAQRGAAESERGPASVHGEIDLDRSHRSTPPTPGGPALPDGGGGDSSLSRQAQRGRSVPARAMVQPAPAVSRDEPEEGLRLLRAAGVRADTACQLAHHSPTQIGRLIAQARARPGVRDVAGWVVSALRALPPEPVEQAAPPKVSDLAILTHPGLTNSERTRWLNRFRAAELSDRPAVLARFHTEHPPEPPAPPG